MIDADELALVRASLAHVLSSSTPAEMPAALLAEGWAELVAGDPGAAITALCTEAGRLRSNAPVADVAMLWAAGVDEIDSAAVVIPLPMDLGPLRLGNREATGPDPVGVVLAGAERAERVVLLGAGGVESVPVAAVQRSAIEGFDPALGLSTATVDRTTVEPLATASAEKVLAVGRLAVTAQMVGAVQEMLTETLDYVIARRQYGREIGSFQTVKHRLAEVKVGVTAASAGLRAAWEVGDADGWGAGGASAAMAAKALAGRAHQLASTHCFQVHGGIAFTVEHGFQQWVRRGLLLDALLGGHEALVGELGRRIITGRAVPRVPALGSPAPPT
jgi:alkylation response protein AidB-like acyl-CoA dehydrogenase